METLFLLLFLFFPTFPKVNLYKYSENDNLKGYVANIYSLKSTNTIHDIDITSSIEEMKNRIQVVTSKLDKEYISDMNNNIKKYGILQEVIEPQKGENNFKKLADDKLKELNKVKNEITLTVLGDYNMQIGIIIPVKKEKIGLNDKYLIKTSNHAIEGTKEKVTIKLEKYEG